MIGSEAVAATATSQFNVKLTIASGCDMLVTTDVDFGVQNFVVDKITGQGSVTIACTNGLPYSVALDGGQANDVNGRQMTHSNGVNKVNYQLYQDSALQVPWGSETSVSVNGTGTGESKVLPVYGLITGPQAVVTGAYLDTITVTLTY